MLKSIRSIRGRLTLWYALSISLLFIVSNFLAYRAFESSLETAMDDTLYAAAESVEPMLKEMPEPKWRESIRRMERGFIVNRLFIQLVEISPEGHGKVKQVVKSGVMAGNISQEKLWERIGRKPPISPVFLSVHEQSAGEAVHPMRLILYPLKTKEERTYIIQVGISLKKMTNVLRSFSIIIWIYAPLLIIITVAGGYLILYKALNPVKTIVETARRITTEELGLRIGGKLRQDEIGMLAHTFNQMVSRLEHSVNQIKQFAGDASHDLKTPLTVIKGEIDIALRKTRDTENYITTLVSIKEETEKLEKVIDNLLFLNHIDLRPEGFLMDITALDEVLLTMYEKTEPLAVSKHIAYMVTKVAPVRVKGNRNLLERLTINLLDNALKYTPENGSVSISLRAENDKAILTVTDSGIGIPEDALPYIFDRFYRVDVSRSNRIRGSGLGLSIVKKIAQLHNVTIDIKSVPGKGTTVTAVFPTIQ